MANTVNILSFNVNGLISPQKMFKMLSKLKKEMVHVALQQHKKPQEGFHKNVFSSSYKSGHRSGITIFISWQISFKYLSVKRDREGQYVLLKVRTDGFPVTILNIYAPPTSNWVFYKNMFKLMTSEMEGLLISGGDMNIRLSKLENSKTDIVKQISLTRNINCIMDETGIIDV